MRAPGLAKEVLKSKRFSSQPMEASCDAAKFKASLRRNFMNIHKIVKSDSVARRLPAIIAVTVMFSLVFIGFVTPVSAGGATPISGIGYPTDATECNDAVTGPEGQAPDLYTWLEGDLVGCQYVFVETHYCTPSGIYVETGSETYVIDGPLGQGTFSTIYRFHGKFEGCGPDGFPTGDEIYGGCQHPIVAGSGTGDYEGVVGKLAFTDDVINWIFPYKGHLRWTSSRNFE
jgi:hypothetical protein